MIQVSQGILKKDCEKLQSFLNVVDSDFVPPLYTRYSDSDEKFLHPNVSIKGFYQAVQDYLHFVVLKDAEIVGWACVNLDYPCTKFSNWKQTAFLSAIAIHPQFRNQGLAQEILEKIQAELHLRQFKGLITRTWGSNEIHQQMLSKRGWVEIDRDYRQRSTEEDTVYWAVLFN